MGGSVQRNHVELSATLIIWACRVRLLRRSGQRSGDEGGHIQRRRCAGATATSPRGRELVRRRGAARGGDGYPAEGGTDVAMAKTAAGGCVRSALWCWDDGFAALQVRNLATPLFAFYPMIKLTPPLFAPLNSSGNVLSFGNDSSVSASAIPSSKPMASTQ